MERWPQRCAHHGGVAGCEEERRRTAFPSEIKRSRLVGWVRKENTELGQALLRRWRHYGDGKSSTELWRWRREKAEEATAKNDGDAGLIMRLRSKKKPCHSLHGASAKAKTAMSAPRTEKKVADDEVASTTTVHQNYQIAIRFKIQITPKFM